MSISGSMISSQPRPTGEQTTALTANVKKLRDQLTNIHKLIQTTQTATEISFEERRDKESANDISVMAVQQVRTQFKVENDRLKSENIEYETQLRDLQQQHQLLKRQYTECQTKEEQAVAELEVVKQQLKTAQDKLKELNDENQTFRESSKMDKERHTQEITLLTKQLQDQKNMNMRLQQTIGEVQTDFQQITDKYNKLKEKSDKVNQQELEDATIEIERASKTVEGLTSVIDELKKKLLEQRATHLETVNSLRTTIAAMQEEMFGDDVDDAERLPRAELERKVVELSEQNAQLTDQIRELTQQISTQPDVQKQAMSGINPMYNDPNSMLGSINFYRPAGLPGGATVSATYRKDENIEDIIQQSRKK